MKQLLLLPYLLLAFVLSTFVSCTSGDEGLLDYIPRTSSSNQTPGDTDLNPKDGDLDGIPDKKKFEITPQTLLDVAQLLEVSHLGSSVGVSVGVDAVSDVVWTATASDPWIVLDPNPVSISGSGAFTITVTATPGSLREGSVVVQTTDPMTKPNLFTIPIAQKSNEDIPTLSADFVSLTEVEDPSVTQSDGVYYVFSSNRALSPLAHENGLMLRTSSDLTQFNFKGYVLNNTFVSAKAKLMELDPSIALANVRMASPSIVKVGSEWRLYYTVYVNSESASVIGYATTASLADQRWIDRGIILTSKKTDAVHACHPSFVEQSGRHFLAYGYGGVDIVELDPLTGKVRPATKANQFTDGVVGDPQITLINGNYYMAVSHAYQWNSSTVRLLKSTSGNAQGPYKNLTNNGWEFAHGFVVRNLIFDNANYFGYRHIGGSTFVQKGSQWYLLHHHQKGVNSLTDEATSEDTDNIFQLMVRKVNLLPFNGLPVVSMDPIALSDQTMTAAEIVGTWRYSTLFFGWINYKPGGEYKFNSDGTLSGTITGTWEFDTAKNQLRIISTTWSGENVYVLVYKDSNGDNLDGSGLPYRYSGSGFNVTYGEHPAVIMRKANNNSDN